MEDPSHYRSTIGAMQYITVTRHEISYSVNRVCPFMGQPLLSHWQSIKKTLGYLKGAVDYGLVLQPYARHQPYNLHAYCDAD